MEPIVESPEDGAHSAIHKRSRVKAAIAAVIVAGALSTWGVASVLAASPSPSPSASSGTTTTGHSCPAHAGSSAAPSSTSS